MALTRLELYRRKLSRREFVASAVAAGAVSPAAAQRRRPNLLYVFSDQHRACSAPGEPFSEVDAPHLARLAREGTSFNTCISNYPVCSPYRGILMSGRWPCETGVIDNAWPLKVEETSLGEAFKNAGYHTGYVGKWHLDARGEEGKALKPAGEARHGFDWWRAWYNTNPHYDTSHTFDPETGEREVPQGYNAARMTDDAIGFIERSKSTEPWMLVVSWNPPHPPFRDAPPELMSKYDAKDLALRPNAGERAEQLIGGGDEARVRSNLAGYYAHIEGVDREMARILDTLERTGQADDTILVYSSDHGEMMGSHGRMGKRLPHEESAHVPFIVRHPGVVPAGETTDVLLSAIDIYPTLCGLAGVDVPGHCRGRDLSGAALGRRIESPESAFLMHIEKDHASGGRNHPAPIFRGLRTPRYTYAVGEIGRWCLYDHQEDPYQLHNLADDPKHAPLMGELDGEILRYLAQAQDKYPFHTLRAARSITSG